MIKLFTLFIFLICSACISSSKYSTEHRRVNLDKKWNNKLVRLSILYAQPNPGMNFKFPMQNFTPIQDSVTSIYGKKVVSKIHDLTVSQFPSQLKLSSSSTYDYDLIIKIKAYSLKGPSYEVFDPTEMAKDIIRQGVTNGYSGNSYNFETRFDLEIVLKDSRNEKEIATSKKQILDNYSHERNFLSIYFYDEEPLKLFKKNYNLALSEFFRSVN